MAVALPAIQADLDLTPGQLQAISTAYAVTFGGLLILAGRAADLYGARRAFLIGLGLFTFASLLCAAGVGPADYRARFASTQLHAVGEREAS